jgi:hypothetical protein
MPQNGPIQTDESGDPVNPWKSGSGGIPGGGSGGGGGGGVSGLGGGGFGGFAPFSTLQGIPGMQNRRKKKFYTMDDETVNGGSVSTPPAGFAMGGQVPPGPRDTVPARLEPGEFVVPREAAQDPQNAQMLEGMQSQALQERGMGGGMGGGMEAPGLSYSALVELLQVLLHGQQGYSLGGWVSKHPWAIPLAVGAAALAPAAIGALGAGGAGGGAAAGGAATAAGPVTAAGVSPMAAVPATQHFGYGASFLGQHPGVAGAVSAGQKYGPSGMAALDRYQAGRTQSQSADEASDSEAISRYLAARQASEQGYAMGGPVGQWPQWRPNWAGPQRQPTPQSGTGLNPTGFPDSHLTGTNISSNWVHPGQYGVLAEAGARDANDFASGVYRNAQLEGADPGSAAAYRLRALASAGRGAADSASKYRTEQMGLESQRLYDLYKQSKDFEYQAKLKGMK